MRTIAGVLLLAATGLALEWSDDVDGARADARARQRPLLVYLFDKY